MARAVQQTVATIRLEAVWRLENERCGIGLRVGSLEDPVREAVVAPIPGRVVLYADLQYVVREDAVIGRAAA